MALFQVTSLGWRRTPRWPGRGGRSRPAAGRSGAALRGAGARGGGVIGRHGRQAIGEEGVFGEGRREQVALAEVAAGVGEALALGVGLDAFGDHVDVELVGHGDDGLGDGQVARVGGEVADEGAVDLEGVDVHPLEVGHGRVAGAEVVDGDLDAGRARRASWAVTAGCSSRSRPSVISTAMQRPGRPRRSRREQHVEGRPLANWRGEALTVICSGLGSASAGAGAPAGRWRWPARTPSADGVDEAELFGHRDELAGRDLARARVVPAQQGFGLADRPLARCRMGW
jgi:hypothetical protein